MHSQQVSSPGCPFPAMVVHGNESCRQLYTGPTGLNHSTPTSRHTPAMYSAFGCMLPSWLLDMLLVACCSSM
jgi:hypothetical protein